MTNEELISKIKAEIERQEKQCPLDTYEGRHKLFILGGLKTFLSTLESEKPIIPITVTVLDNDLNPIEITADNEVKVEPSGSSEVPKDLEEAAENYAMRDKWTYEHFGDVVMKAVFFGAKWQEKKDQETIKLAEDHAFLAGADWQKEQLMRGEKTQQNISERFKDGMSFNMGKIDG